jgi:hypothetical protein
MIQVLNVLNGMNVFTFEVGFVSDTIGTPDKKVKKIQQIVDTSGYVTQPVRGCYHIWLEGDDSPSIQLENVRAIVIYK